MGVFLSARWHDLLLLNYAVPDALLVSRLAPGLELDRHDGSAWVSLVAFDFLGTRVLGVPWPGYTDFVEINLRFYVRQGERRGVSFVREIVPKRLVAWIARALYNEPYVYAPVTSDGKRVAGRFEKSFNLDWRGKAQILSVRASDTAWRPSSESVEHFFKEHEWGFGRSRSGDLVTYRVEHPHWDVYPIESTAVNFDFGAVYGPEWAWLTRTAPQSVVLAAGSAIKVFSKT